MIKKVGIVNYFIINSVKSLNKNGNFFEIQPQSTSNDNNPEERFLFDASLEKKKEKKRLITHSMHP